MSSNTPPANHPEAIGRYRIVRPLGSGAMGDVYLAQDPHIDRRLAIKTVRVVGGTETDIEERKRRLLREARAAGKLLHPNVVALFDADTADGVLYLAFEYVEGQDLAQRAVVTPALTLRQVLNIAREVAHALDYAHGEGIVHRDIKPSNILIGSGGIAKVADFGIAKLRDGSTELTRTGSVVGSPQYMSPEQVRGEPLDGRSDLFSLGVLLYELLCRHRPFGGDTLSTLVFEILAKEPLAVDQLNPGALPAGLVDLVHRLLAKHREQRPAAARDVAGELDALLTSLPAAVLDAAAVPGMPGPSRVAPGTSPSGGPVASGSSSPGSASVSPVAPTATLDSARTRPSGAMPPPPPPPPGAPSGPPSATPSTTAPPAAAPPAAAPPAAAPTSAPAAAQTSTLVQERPSPIDTGTYGGPNMTAGRRGLIAAAAILVIAAAVVGGWWFGRSEAPATDDDPAPTEQVARTSVPEARTSTSPTTDEPSTGTTPTDGTQPTDESPDPTGHTDGPGATGPGSAAPPSASPPPSAAPSRNSTPSPSGTPSPRTAPPPPRQTAPPRQAPPRQAPPRQAPPRQAPPSTTPTPPPAAMPPAQGPQPSTPPSAPAANPRIAAFDAAATSASRELDTGLSFQFDVRPDDTIVKIQRRGERSLVQGAVSNFDPADDDARVLELPGSGDYLITLVHERYPDVVAL
ncbi:MAG: serine/threonine-protein kinase, partial [Acidobacteriota bacterium]